MPSLKPPSENVAPLTDHVDCPVRAPTDRPLSSNSLPWPQGREPLLPEVLRGPFSLLGLWVLPIAILLALDVQAYALLKTSLNPAQQRGALWLGLCDAANLLTGLSLWVAAWISRRRQGRQLELHPLHGVVLALFQATLIFIAFRLSQNVVPSGVASWIFPQERIMLHHCAFGMVPLLLGVLWLAGLKLSPSPSRLAAIQMSLGLVVPVALFLIFSTGHVFKHSSSVEAIAVAGFVVIIGVLLLSVIFRGVLTALRALRSRGPRGEQVAIGIFSLGLPLAGLLLNRAIPFPYDFQSPAVYVLTVATSACLLLSSVLRTRHPLWSLFLAGAALPYTLYFFCVFLPFLPLSIPALLAFGAGLLVMTPTMLFLLHLQGVANAWQASGSRRHTERLGLLILGILIVPIAYTARGLVEKRAINTALDYVYRPSVPSGNLTYPADLDNLRRALAGHRAFKEGLYYPLLSDFHSWVVFDNLVLSDEKIRRLEQTFFGANNGPVATPRPVSSMGMFGSSGRRARWQDAHRMPAALSVPRTVDVTWFETRLTAKGPADTVATARLVLTNQGRTNAEYVTTLPLPAGVLATGFRLQVNGVLVPGRLVEKKSALWIYTMIRDQERRDPGVLFYRHDQELELRVFPVIVGTPSVVEMDFLVPVPIETLTSGNPRARDPLPTASLDQTGVTPGEWLAGFEKNLGARRTSTDSGDVIMGLNARPDLPGLERPTYLHLLIDRSVDHGYRGDLATAARWASERFPQADQFRVSLVNHQIIDVVGELTPFARLPRLSTSQLDHALREEGGFLGDLALARALRRHVEQDLNRWTREAELPPRPIFVVISDHAAARTWELELTNHWQHFEVDSPIEELGADGTTFTHRPGETFRRPLIRSGTAIRPVLPQQTLLLPRASAGAPLFYATPSSAGITWKPLAAIESAAPDSAWSKGMAIQAAHETFARNPGKSTAKLGDVVAQSREANVLTPATSYIVVETAAQWQRLAEVEDQKLGQNSALDVLEAPAPPIVWVALGFLGWAAWQRRRRPSLNPRAA